MTDKTSLALDLLALDFWLLPLEPNTKRPLLKNGFHDASNDAETVATWFTGEFANAAIGVWTGASGIVVADLDRKNSKDGFVGLEDAWLTLPETFSYPTKNNGEHHIYAAPTGANLTGNADYRGISGLDRRGGGSYIYWHADTAPLSRDEFSPAPAWLLDEADVHDPGSFSGTVTEWMEEFGSGEPGERVLRAVSDFPQGDITHSQMVASQYHLIRLGCEGAEGAAYGLGVLRQAWLNRDPKMHSTPIADWNFKFDEALESGIAKYGQEQTEIAALPPYVDSLEVLPTGFPLEALMGVSGPKKAYYEVLDRLVRVELLDSTIAAIMWGAPTVKRWSHEWGIQYLYEQIAEQRGKLATDMEPRENPVKVEALTRLNTDEIPISLLSDKERELVDLCPTFIDRYLAFVESRTQHPNLPYHRAAGWTVISLVTGMYGFISEDEGAMGLNLFIIVLGDSSTGKTRAIKLRDALLHEFFLGDAAYDLGGNPSPEALHDALLKRDGKASHFNTDEADSALAMWLDRKYLAGLIGFITNTFEGVVGVMLRRGQKEEERRRAVVSFNLSLWGTPDAVTELLTEKLFKSGFLPRPVWFLGDPKLVTDERFRISRGRKRISDMDFDPVARAFAAEFVQLRRTLGRRRPVNESGAALDRLEVAKKQMHEALSDSPRWPILEPSITRLGDNMRKAAALLALADHRDTVTLVDMLAAIEQGEEWMRNVVQVADRVVASDFQRGCDLMELTLLNNGGTMTLTKLTHAFRALDPKEFSSRLESLKAQGRVNFNAAGTMVVINEGRE